MTTIEALDKIASRNGYNNWARLLHYEEDCAANIISYTKQAMEIYAQQFIDGANEIITPVTIDILSPTYQEELDKWFELTNLKILK